MDLQSVCDSLVYYKTGVTSQLIPNVPTSRDPSTALGLPTLEVVSSPSPVGPPHCLDGFRKVRVPRRSCYLTHGRTNVRDPDRPYTPRPRVHRGLLCLSLLVLVLFTTFQVIGCPPAVLLPEPSEGFGVTAVVYGSATRQGPWKQGRSTLTLSRVGETLGQPAETCFEPPEHGVQGLLRVSD